MSLFPHATVVLLDTIIAPLVPWFLTAAGGDMEAARQAVLSMLASYSVESEEEIRLAAEIVSFSFGALAALSKSVDPDLPLNAVLRLRGSANALQRSKHQCQRVLDRLRGERRMPPPAPQPQPKPRARPPAPTVPPSPAQPRPGFTLSRQQRRALERAAEEAQRVQAKQARRDAMPTMHVVPLTAPATTAARQSPAAATA